MQTVFKRDFCNYTAPVFSIGTPDKFYLLFEVVLLFYRLNPIVVIPARLRCLYFKDITTFMQARAGIQELQI